jgi:hypothetical protein
LRQRHTALKTFIFSGNNVGEKGAEAISAALRVNTTLTHLDLSNNGIMDVGAACVAEALRESRGLECLILSFNGITKEGMKKLGASFNGYHSLKKVDLDNNKIENDGAEALSDAVQHMSIQVLNVAFNNIESRGLRRIAQAVCASSSVTGLSLSGNKISSDVAGDVHNLVLNSRILRALALDCHSVGEAGQIQIASGIAGNSQSALEKFNGFLLGPAMVQLGSPPELAPLTNEKCLLYLRTLWKDAQREFGGPGGGGGVQSGGGSSRDGSGGGGSRGEKSGGDSGGMIDGGTGALGDSAGTHISLHDILALSRSPGSLNHLIAGVSGDIERLVGPSDDRAGGHNGNIRAENDEGRGVYSDYLDSTLCPEDNDNLRGGEESGKGSTSGILSGAFAFESAVEALPPREESVSRDSLDPRSKSSLTQLQHNVAPALVKRVRDLGNEEFHPGELWELHQHYFSHVSAKHDCDNGRQADGCTVAIEGDTLSEGESDGESDGKTERMTIGRKSLRRGAGRESPLFSRKRRKGLTLRIDAYPEVKKMLASLKEDGDENGMLIVMRQLRMLEECRGKELDEEADIEAVLLFSR